MREQEWWALLGREMVFKMGKLMCLNCNMSTTPCTCNTSEDTVIPLREVVSYHG